jgi:SnoaL-like domain
MQGNVQPKGVVMSYIAALDRRSYEEAMSYLDGEVRIKGPAGETLGKPLDFVEMLRKYRGRYDVKKVFVDGEDVCVLYHLSTTGPTVYMSSWYQVKDGKIVSIQTVFDPKGFGSPTSNNLNPGDA